MPFFGRKSILKHSGNGSQSLWLHGEAPRSVRGQRERGKHGQEPLLGFPWHGRGKAG